MGNPRSLSVAGGGATDNNIRVGQQATEPRYGQAEHRHQQLQATDNGQRMG
jgi:hypothetical protein